MKLAKNIPSISIRIASRENGNGSEGYDVVALNASESSRARGLLDRVSVSGEIKNGIDTEQKNREDAIELELTGKSDRLLRLRLRKKEGMQNEIERLLVEIAAKENELQELHAEMRRKSPRYADLVESIPAGVHDR